MRRFCAWEPLCPAVCSEAHFHLNVFSGSLLAIVEATLDWWPLMRFMNAPRVRIPVAGADSHLGRALHHHLCHQPHFLCPNSGKRTELWKQLALLFFF